MADHEQLRTIRAQTLAILAQVTAEPKPSYTIDGQAVSWGDYLARLQATVDWCDRKLVDDEPFEAESQAST
jgi:hypothetical protein